MPVGIRAEFEQKGSRVQYRHGCAKAVDPLRGILSCSIKELQSESPGTGNSVLTSPALQDGDSDVTSPDPITLLSSSRQHRRRHPRETTPSALIACHLHTRRCFASSSSPFFCPHQQALIRSLQEHPAGRALAKSVWRFLITLTAHLLLSLTSVNSTHQRPTAKGRQLFVPRHRPKAHPTKANMPSLCTRWFMYVYACSMYTLCFQTAGHLPVLNVLSHTPLY